MTFPLLALCVFAIACAATVVAALAPRWKFVPAVAGAGGILALHSIAYFDYTSDDAYISYRYARHFADGIGLVWNPGEYVEGYSNFLWTAWLAGFAKAGAGIEDSARWLGFGLGVGALALTFALTSSLAPRRDAGWAALAATLLLAASGPFAIWATAGLETPLFAALVLGGMVLHVREQPLAATSDGSRLVSTRAGRRRPPLSALAWALAAMTRPEGPLLFAASGIAKVAESVATARSPIVQGRRFALREAAHMAGWAAIFAAVYGSYFAWRYATYDHFFPNAYYAKVGSGLDQYDRGLYYLGIFAREHAAWLLAIVPVALTTGSLRRPPALYALWIVLAWTGYVVYVGGDSLLRFRFFAPMLPAMYALICASVAAFARDVQVRGHPLPAPALAVAGAALLMFTLYSSSTDPGIWLERGAIGERVAAGRWLRDEMPAGTTIAVIPAGAIPFESRLETIDMLGINDEHIAHQDVSLGRFPAGHEKFDTEYVLDREPDIIILTDSFDGAPRGRDDYLASDPGVIPARVDMLLNERLWEEYEPRAVRFGEDAWLNLLVRRDASVILARTLAP